MNTALDLTLRLQDLLSREHGALSDFLVALANFDRRRLWLDLGYASLFDYLRRELGLSKASAFFRMKAAALLQRFPDLAEPLRDGRLCLSSVAELAKVITEANKDEVLPRFFLLSKREAKAVSAALRPDEAPPRRDLVTTVRVPVEARPLKLTVPPTSPAPECTESPSSLKVVSPDKPGSASPSAAAEIPRIAASTAASAAVEPLTAELNRLHVTVSRRFLEKLEAAKAALSHSHPGAGTAEVLEAALDLVLERHAKRNGLVKNPRKEPRPSKNPDRVPANVRRAVWERDGGRCQAPIASGGVCGRTVRPELHHVVSRARGGPPTVENLTTLCDLHHDLETRREFGDALVDACARREAQRTAPP